MAADAALAAAKAGLIDASAAVEAAREEAALADRAARTCRAPEGSPEAAAAPEREVSAAAAARAAAQHFGGQLAQLWAAVASLDARRAWEQARGTSMDCKGCSCARRVQGTECWGAVRKLCAVVYSHRGTQPSYPPCRL